MDAARFAQIARQLPGLLDQQMRTLVGRNLDSLSESERVAYDQRKAKILQLRRELESLRTR
jgi:hypothetical protein